MLKAQVIPSLLLIIMGSIDCITTVIGVLYHGATELNPFLAGIVSTNIGAFLVVKLAATMIVASFIYCCKQNVDENPKQKHKNFHLLIQINKNR